jgi:hypothetical protein
VSAAPWARRVEATDWAAVRAGLDGYGCALTGPLLTADEAAGIAALYSDGSRFRATVDMRRHRFGEGEYRYFSSPFLDAVAGLKEALYPKLLPVAASGGPGRAARRRGRTSWRAGWRCATRPGRPSRRRSCSGTGLAVGTPCTVICTVS